MARTTTLSLLGLPGRWFDFSGVTKETQTITYAELALYYQIANDVDVDAIIDGRVYPIDLPVGADLPAVTYQRIGTARFYELAGSVDLKAVRFQVNVIADDQYEVITTADAVATALDGASGTINAIDVDHMEINDEYDLPWIADTNELQTRYVRVFDVTLWHR